MTAGVAVSLVYLMLLAIFVVIVCVVGREKVVGRERVVSPGSPRPPSFSSGPSAGRGRGNANRGAIENEAFAARMASLIVVVFSLVVLIMCVQTFQIFR